MLDRHARDDWETSGQDEETVLVSRTKKHGWKGHETKGGQFRMSLDTAMRPKSVASGSADEKHTRACRQLSQMRAAARWTAARKLWAVLSYRVAIAGNCKSLAKKFSIRWRAA